MQQAMKRARKKDGELEDDEEVCTFLGHCLLLNPVLVGGTDLSTHRRSRRSSRFDYFSSLYVIDIS